MTQLMEILVVLVALIAFVAFLVRGDEHFRARRAREKAGTSRGTDAQVLACIVEQQARLDLMMTATRTLLRTHPNSADVAVVLRAAATHLNATSSREAPDMHAVYERTLTATLEALVGD